MVKDIETIDKKLIVCLGSLILDKTAVNQVDILKNIKKNYLKVFLQDLLA